VFGDLELCCQHPERFPDPEDPHHAFEIVGQHVKAHLSAYAGQRSTEKVRSTHPELDGAKRMFHRSSAHSHALGFAIEPLLHGFEY
jgi:hypothetical protein